MTSRKRLLFESVFPLALALAAGCGGTLSEPREIASTTDSGLVELVFYMTRHERFPDGRQGFTAEGRNEGRQVGFDLELSKWEENPPGYVNMTIWECPARLVSKGDQSDELLRAMDQLFGARTAPEHMVSELPCSLLSPWKDPGQFEERGAKLIALFQMLPDMDLPPEIWIDVHPQRKRIALREKDPRLRKALLQSWTEREEPEEP